MTLIVADSGLGVDFDAAVRKITRTMSLGFGLYKDTLCDEIATIDTVSKQAIAQLMMLIDGSGYVVKGLSDDTDYSNNPPKIIGECGYKRLDLFGIKWEELADEFTKRTQIASMPQLAGKPRQVVLLEVLKYLNSNPTTLYDNLALFHASHKVDPFDTGPGTHSNLITAAKSSTGWNSVLQAIMTRQDPGSKASTGRNYMPNGALTGKNLSIWTGDTGVYTDLAKIFEPSALWAASTATETRKVFAQAALQYVPEMSAYSSGPGGAYMNYVYIIIKDTDDRPLYVRMPDAPRVEPVERIPSKHLSRTKAWQTFGITTGHPLKIYIWRFS